jgi:hypothetical protein
MLVDSLAASTSTGFIPALFYRIDFGAFLLYLGLVIFLRERPTYLLIINPGVAA